MTDAKGSLRHRAALGAACVAMMALGRAASAADGPPTTGPTTVASTAAPAVHDAAYWNALEKRLGDEDPKSRRAAQKELETISYHERAALESLAARATDDEIKSRLQMRVEEIDEQLALNPPPISIHLKDAGIEETVNALQRATGIAMKTWQNGNNETFTLDATEQPFWKVFTDLSAQHGLAIQPNISQLTITRQDPGLTRFFPATGGFVVFPNQLQRSRTADLQSNAVGAEQLTFSYTLAADPRITIIHYSPVTLTDVVDDAGNVLLHTIAARDANNVMQSYETLGWFQSSSSLQIPDHPGKRITSAIGEAHMVIQVASVQVDIDAPQDKIGKPIRIADRTFTVQTFRPHDGVIDINFLVSSPPRPAPLRGGFIPEMPIHLEVLGSDGRVAWSSMFNGNMGGGIGTGDIKGPFKLRLSIPTRTKDVLVKFEMKDIPLPALR